MDSKAPDATRKQQDTAARLAREARAAHAIYLRTAASIIWTAKHQHLNLPSLRHAVIAKLQKDSERPEPSEPER